MLYLMWDVGIFQYVQQERGRATKRTNALEVLEGPCLSQRSSEIQALSTYVPTLTTGDLERGFRGPCGNALTTENGSRALPTARCSI